MCVGGLDGRLMQVNAAFCRMLGYSEQELLAKTWTELTHPDDLGPALEDRSDCGESRANSWRWRNAISTAAELWCGRGSRSLWYRIAVGIPQYFVVHVEDITERKRAEEALRESEERFRIMADGCPTMMWVTDARGRDPVHQPGMPRILRAPPIEQVEGGRWQLVVHPDDARRYIDGVPARGAGTRTFPGRSARPACRWRVAVGGLLRGATLFPGR